MTGVRMWALNAGMTTNNYVPSRGDLVWTFFDPALGHEQAGRHPAIVLSERSYSVHTNMAIICPITSKIIGLPGEVVLRETQTIKGAVLVVQLRSVDIHKRKFKFVERAPLYIVNQVTYNVAELIGAYKIT